MCNLKLIFLMLHFLFKKCSNHEIVEGRIVNGEYSRIRDNAHAVLLHIIRRDHSAHICGSSVLNQNFLLSAAHCFYELDIVQVIAIAGHEDVRKSTVSRIASKVTIHEHFQLQTVENDIALVSLNGTLPLGANIKRIVLKKSFPRQAKGILAGWGYINDDDGPPSQILKMVKQTVLPRRDCRYLKLRPGMLCAGSLIPTESRPAKGDSGSGLITKRYQIIGILSYKLNSLPALPVYTNVTYYYNWIKNLTIKKHCTIK
ncbi:transmembrane protease serine 11F-like [Danaus plexippus]|uniref:transmembrane protease serine 11F-like n=1 Tax=Danaus plexippus TaxID=13037 RepID=UPI002AB271E0|nr:transmembrane protease serine 11F-like [Danaus plexippus]